MNIIETNMNFNIVIYPSDKGWDKIYEIIQKAYYLDTLNEAIEYVNKYRKTEDGGYKEQMWEIMSSLGELFYNGTPYFNTTNIKIFNEQ